MMRATLLGVTLAIALAASATKMDATDAALDLRLKKLETELRCLVCQNQTIADSNADLAGDLRREVRDLALAGKTDAQIREYLVATRMRRPVRARSPRTGRSPSRSSTSRRRRSRSSFPRPSGSSLPHNR